jgi:hypothetical protein
MPSGAAMPVRGSCGGDIHMIPLAVSSHETKMAYNGITPVDRAQISLPLFYSLYIQNLTVY